MKLEGKKVLVTGADGFIGSHLVEELVARKAQVSAFVYYNAFNSWGWIDSSLPEIKDKIQVFSGDVRDSSSVRKAMEDVEIVFHLAALIGIPFSYTAPDSYVETNIKGTLNILQAARLLGTKKIILTSTSEVYGTAQFVPISEEHPICAQSPYAATKAAADQLALSFYRSFDTPVIVIRPFNTYGPRQSARAVIPTVITQIANHTQKLKLGSLTPTRDFSYVTDTARGFIAAAQSDASFGEVINLGSGFEISIGETVSLISKIMGAEIEVETETERIRPKKSEVSSLLADTTKARQLLGWKPEYGSREGFQLGLTRTIDWFRKTKNLSRYKFANYNL